jgi:hypothetical protein
MILYNNAPPKWENAGIEPTDYEKAEGYSAGDKVPADYLNFYLNKLYLCVEELQNKLSNENTSREAAMFNAKPVVINETLLASKWTDRTYVWNNSNIKSATQIIELVPQSSITVEQLNALQYANIVGTSQTVGKITLQAMGELPTVDIPVTFIIRGDV